MISLNHRCFPFRFLKTEFRTMMFCINNTHWFYKQFIHLYVHDIPSKISIFLKFSYNVFYWLKLVMNL